MMNHSSSNMINLVQAISSRNNQVEGDYINDAGLLICGKCHTKKQNFYNMLGTEYKATIMCKCEAEAYDKAQEEDAEKQRQIRINNKRNRLIRDNKYKDYTFENDDKSDIKISNACLKYVMDFKTFKEKNTGLLFYGSVGTGKTFMAGAIANALLDKGRAAMITNIPFLIDKMTFDDKDEILKLMHECDLVVFDDLGVERNSHFAKEKLFEIVDARYRSGKPSIFTTNLTPDELKNAQLENARLYDRILEMCIPIKLSGNSRRRIKAQENFKEAKNLLGL